jgi:hypothetical protein
MCGERNWASTMEGVSMLSMTEAQAMAVRGQDGKFPRTKANG